MFAIYKHHIEKEEKTVMYYCMINKISYKICSRIEDAPVGYIPIGSVEWCEKFLPKEVTTPNYYPEFLKDYLFRKVWSTDKWPIGKKVFIKPADRHKRFTGFITTGTYKKKKKEPYWCSEIISFVNEWRYYVANGKILTGEWYWGDEINTPDAPILDAKIPDKFCGVLDFGITNQGKLALVEAHPPYACGWYGKINNPIYVEWLINGWKWLHE